MIPRQMNNQMLIIATKLVALRKNCRHSSDMCFHETKATSDENEHFSGESSLNHQIVCKPPMKKQKMSKRKSSMIEKKKLWKRKSTAT